ncbi:hypothetical protein [Alsobacter metallidurans]|nr:hypothetical protein [Alsobacter metallidurans]
MDELAALRRRRGLSASGTHPRHIMDAVYTAGTIAISPDETLARIVVRQLHRMGLLLAEEIQPDGTLRPLPGGHVNSGRPWRVSRPAIDGEAGRPDAFGMA